MKKARLFIGMGILAVAISAAFVTKANTKFDTVYYKSGTDCLSETFTPSCTSGNNQCTDASSRLIFSDVDCTVKIPKQ